MAMPSTDDLPPGFRTLPETVTAYKRTPTFTEATVPAALREDHSTKPGTWGVIRVQSGTLIYALATGETMTLSEDCLGVIEPEVPHRVIPDGPVSFFVEFYR